MLRSDDIQDQLAALGIQVGCAAIEQSLRYLECVLASDRANVTAIKDPEEAVRLHVIDSLLALPAVSSAPEGTLVDLGTGGGFPGVPLGLASGRVTVLLDSVGRKLELIDECLATADLDLSASTVHARSEEYALSHGASASVVVARAVAEMPALLELCRPLVPNGGRIILLKGPAVDEELDRARGAAELLGLTSVGDETFTLPGGDEFRRVFVFEASAPPSVELPRRPGRATKKPLV